MNKNIFLASLSLLATWSAVAEELNWRFGHDGTIGKPPTAIWYCLGDAPSTLDNAVKQDFPNGNCVVVKSGASVWSDPRIIPMIETEKYRQAAKLTALIDNLSGALSDLPPAGPSIIMRALRVDS